MMDRRFPIHRREFLKLARLFLLSGLLPGGFLAPPDRQGDKKTPNFLIIVFDALSAMNMSLYGYPRLTTPNIDRIAERATVYHNHYAGGHWTYPGTASLLTGALPWSHRAFSQTKHIIEPHNSTNIFGLFENYYRISYTHNPIADGLLSQLGKVINQRQERRSLFLNEFSLSNPDFLNSIFSKDNDIASVSWIRHLVMRDDGHANSLLLAYLTQYLEVDVVSKYQDMFPGGPPSLWDGSYFFLEDAIDWIINNSMQTPKPYLAYYHMFPPHIPYRTRGDFYGRFANDGYHPIEKEEHFFTQNVAQPGLDRNRQQYDEYILYADAEFGRLITAMEANGNLEETWIILTSDHGEMFERGIRGHRQPVFHQPVSRVPLMILPPRQTARQDIYAPTSAVDLLPTLLHLSGEPAPDFIEGDVLPPFSTQNRGEGYFIFALDARMNHPSKPLTTGTFMLVKDNYKLTYYVGYDQLPGGEPFFELYDLAEDPEEVRNLYREHPRQASQMADELLQKLEEKNRPYV